MAVSVTDMFWNLNSFKKFKIAKNSTNTEASKKIKIDLQSSEFHIFLDAGFTKFKTEQILLNKISHRFLDTTKLFIGWSIPISVRKCKERLFPGIESVKQKKIKIQKIFVEFCAIRIGPTVKKCFLDSN